ncbi:unnamed protein product [Chrysoparadoxa australica]
MKDRQGSLHRQGGSCDRSPTVAGGVTISAESAGSTAWTLQQGNTRQNHSLSTKSSPVRLTPKVQHLQFHASF